MRERYDKNELSDGQLAQLQACKFDFHGIKSATACNVNCCTDIKVTSSNNDLDVDSRDEKELDDKNEFETKVCREYNNVVVYFFYISLLFL